MEQISYIGNDGWDEVSRFLNEKNLCSVLLVTGRSAYTSSGTKEALDVVLQGKKVHRVYDFETNPKAEDVDLILKSIRHGEYYDVIIAAGGGSVMDVGKLLKAFWTSDNLVAGHLAGLELLAPDDIPLIAVPSTAGSGSEATHFAVVYHGKKKFSIAHDKLLPDLAVVIPSLLVSLPQNVAAASGMDALCQGMESYWSIYSTEESQSIAKQAISLAWKSLKEAVRDKTPQSLENIARASHLAGMAINLTKTTAPHAVSYALTSFYDIPHGHAVGLLIPQFLKYNIKVTDEDCLDPRGARWVKNQLTEISNLLECESVTDAADALVKLMKDVYLETSLSTMGVESAQDIDVIVKNGLNPQRVNNNPRRVTEERLRGILTGMLA